MHNVCMSKKTDTDRHVTPRKPVSITMEWHELLDNIKKKTGRNKSTEVQMAIYQRAIILGIPKSELPEKPFEEG